MQGCCREGERGGQAVVGELDARDSASTNGRGQGALVERPYFLLAQGLTAKSPLCRPRQDNKNSHRAETELGLRLIGQPSGPA